MNEIEDQVRLLADRRFARTAAVPTEFAVKAGARSFNDQPPAESANHTVPGNPDEGELIMVDIQPEEAGKTQAEDMNRRKWARRAILAAVAAVIVVVGVAVFDDTEEPSEIAIFGPESSLAVVDDYFATYNAGDVDSLLALFTDDATFSSNLSASNGELRLVWSLAQGTALTSPECSVVDEVAGVAVTVSCEYGTLQATALAVDAPVVSTTAKMTIGPDGISDLSAIYRDPHFTSVGYPFDQWMNTNHPEDAEAAGCCEGDTVEESVARGELRARYAKEWAAHLEATDCIYLNLHGC